MKRKLTRILTALLTLTLTCTPILAEGNSEEVKVSATKEAAGEKSLSQKDELESAIKLVKSKFDIPSNYSELTSEVNSGVGSTIYRLRWSSNASYSSVTGGSLEIAVDSYGNIISYYHYRYGKEYEYQRRLPKITGEQAQDYAKKFIYYVSPDIADEIEFEPGTKNYVLEYEGNYRFYFYRQHDSIPLYENGISIMVNGITGEVMNYSRTWTDGLEFPDAAGKIKVKEAQEAYKKNIGIALKYRRTYGENTVKTYLEYSPESDNTYSSIDAFTGEKVVEGSKYNPYYDIIGYNADKYKVESGQSKDEISLSENELSEVTQIGEVITVESAEKLVRDMKELGILDTFRLNRYTYSKYNTDNNFYTLRLEFVKPFTEEDFGGEIPKEKLMVMIAAGEYGRMANVTLNAKTGELIQFNSYGSYGSNETKTVLKRADMQKIVDAFLSKHKAQKFAQLALSGGNPEYYYKYGVNDPNDNSFVFTRKVNGVLFEDNKVSVNVDPATGYITNYNETWDDLEFVSTKGVMGLSRAYIALFNSNDLELKYVTVPVSGDKAAEAAKKGMAPVEVKLVYAPSVSKPVCIDAKKGKLINYYNGEPFKESGAPKYNDIQNHEAKEQITALAEVGVLPDISSFRPDEVIVQKDFLYMISKLRGDYYVQGSTGILKQKEMDAMYRMLINSGVINEDEKNPDMELSREETVKYLIRSIGYQKFAEMEGIFNCDFADAKEIHPKLVGYVTIAKALGIIKSSDGYFRPKQGMTRAEAVKLIYNYMKK